LLNVTELASVLEDSTFSAWGDILLLIYLNNPFKIKVIMTANSRRADLYG